MMERGKYLSWVFHRIFFCLVVSTWTSPRLKNHDIKKKKMDFESLFLSMDLSCGRYLAENLLFSSLHCSLDGLDFFPFSPSGRICAMFLFLLVSVQSPQGNLPQGKILPFACSWASAPVPSSLTHNNVRSRLWKPAWLKPDLFFSSWISSGIKLITQPDKCLCCHGSCVWERRAQERVFILGTDPM